MSELHSQVLPHAALNEMSAEQGAPDAATVHFVHSSSGPSLAATEAPLSQDMSSDGVAHVTSGMQQPTAPAVQATDILSAMMTPPRPQPVVGAALQFTPPAALVLQCPPAPAPTPATPVPSVPPSNSSTGATAGGCTVSPGNSRPGTPIPSAGPYPPMRDAGRATPTFTPIALNVNVTGGPQLTPVEALKLSLNPRPASTTPDVMRAPAPHRGSSAPPCSTMVGPMPASAPISAALTPPTALSAPIGLMELQPPALPPTPPRLPSDGQTAAEARAAAAAAGVPPPPLPPASIPDTDGACTGAAPGAGPGSVGGAESGDAGDRGAAGAGDGGGDGRGGGLDSAGGAGGGSGGSGGTGTGANAVPQQRQMSALAAHLAQQQLQLQKHQEALRAQQKYLEEQQMYIQQLCSLQEKIRHETPENAARMLALRDAPVGRPNQWNYQQAPSVPPVSLAAPKSRLLPKEEVEKLTNWLDAHILHPYPTKEELLRLVRETGLTEVQVTNWFNNARRRHKNLFSLPERAVRILHGWFRAHMAHPFPTAAEVQQLVQQIGLNMTAPMVERWIAHARTLNRHALKHFAAIDGSDSGAESAGATASHPAPAPMPLPMASAAAAASAAPGVAVLGGAGLSGGGSQAVPGTAAAFGLAPTTPSRPGSAPTAVRSGLPSSQSSPDSQLLPGAMPLVSPPGVSPPRPAASAAAAAPAVPGVVPPGGDMLGMLLGLEPPPPVPSLVGRTPTRSTSPVAPLPMVPLAASAAARVGSASVSPVGYPLGGPSTAGRPVGSGLSHLALMAGAQPQQPVPRMDLPDVEAHLNAAVTAATAAALASAPSSRPSSQSPTGSGGKRKAESGPGEGLTVDAADAAAAAVIKRMQLENSERAA